MLLLLFYSLTTQIKKVYEVIIKQVIDKGYPDEQQEAILSELYSILKRTSCNNTIIYRSACKKVLKNNPSLNTLRRHKESLKKIVDTVISHKQTLEKQKKRRRREGKKIQENKLPQLPENVVVEYLKKVVLEAMQHCQSFPKRIKSSTNVRDLLTAIIYDPCCNNQETYKEVCSTLFPSIFNLDNLYDDDYVTELRKKALQITSKSDL